MYKILTVAVLLFAGSITGNSQQRSGTYENLESRLRQRLDVLQRYRYSQQQAWDVEAYAAQTATLLVQLLAQPESGALQVKSFRNLEGTAKSDDPRRLRVYAFGYHCGGTRGWITHSVLQWRDDAGKLHAYDLSRDVFCAFHALHRLPSRQGHFYLLIGDEKGNASSIQDIAYVFRIDNDRFAPASKAFVDRARITLKNMAMAYDEKAGVLQIGSDEEQPFDDDYLLSIKVKDDEHPATATRKLMDLLAQGDGPGICLRFVDGSFERTVCPPRPDTRARDLRFDRTLAAVLHSSNRGFRPLRGKILRQERGDTLFRSATAFEGSLRNEIRVQHGRPALFTCLIFEGSPEEAAQQVSTWRLHLDRIPGAYSCDALNEEKGPVLKKGFVFTSYSNPDPYRIVLAWSRGRKGGPARAWLTVQAPPALPAKN